MQKERASHEYQRLMGHAWLLPQKKAKLATVKSGEGIP
jgi:hypothetical protein